MCKAQGHALSPLTPGEAKMAWDRNLMPRPQARAWEYWSVRLKKAGEYPAGAPKSARGRLSRPAAKSAAARRGGRAAPAGTNGASAAHRSRSNLINVSEGL